MARITPKNQEETKNEDNVDTQLELLKYATQVQSGIKTNITSDFTLCKLNEQDKEGVTNMTVNAYVVKRKINQIKKHTTWWKWNGQTWTTTKPEEKLNEISKLGDIAFDMYMTKVMMTAVLNRNVNKNYLLKFLKNQREDEEEQEENNLSTNKKIKNRIIKDKEKEE